jgi:hypothetical protein
MKRLRKKLFSLSAVLLLSVAGVIAQITPPVSATGHITAEVIPIFSASETSQMNFGQFSPGPQGGEIILTPESNVSVIGSVFTGRGFHNAASFYVSGDIDAAFSISLPGEPVILKHITSARTMLIVDWNSVPSTGIGTGRLQNGFQVVNVGATLKVGTLNDNPVGIYNGTYNITFDFN